MYVYMYCSFVLQQDWQELYIKYTMYFFPTTIYTDCDFWTNFNVFFFLQKTSHGERKILDLIDTTGDGDVDTSTIRTTTDTAGRKIKSLTGRLLNLPDSWNNPTGEWHIGAKPEFEFFPSAVKTRLQVLCNYIHVRMYGMGHNIFLFSVGNNCATEILRSVSVPISFYIFLCFLRGYILCTCNGEKTVKRMLYVRIYVKQEPESYSSVKSYPSVKTQMVFSNYAEHRILVLR